MEQDNGTVITAQEAVASEAQLFDCPHDECGASQSVQIVGEAHVTSKEPLGYCDKCKGWTIDNPPDILVGGPAGLKQRRGDLCCKFTLNAAGRARGLTKVINPLNKT
ncbi:MAG: hypothetical protein HZC01_03695 [Candidatus Kerfeldbacteria bacterium]|nr:hypothetical protein [Candidatus Kerfeldbacteria bacterium]